MSRPYLSGKTAVTNVTRTSFWEVKRSELVLAQHAAGCGILRGLDRRPAVAAP
jgi:hypothetical protein